MVIFNQLLLTSYHFYMYNFTLYVLVKNRSTVTVSRRESGIGAPPPTTKPQEMYHITNASYDLSAGGAPYWLAPGASVPVDPSLVLVFISVVLFSFSVSKLLCDLHFLDVYSLLRL